MKVFDVHVHVFPEKIAEKASASIGAFYSLKMRCDGTLGTALRELDEGGVSACAMHSVATSPAQCAKINAFLMAAAGEHPGRIVPFAALHPGLENMEEYIETALEAGFRGFKIHPDIQGFPLDRPDVVRMLGAAAGKAPVLIHAGDARYDNSGPRKIAALLDRFPALTAICAHLGGYSEWDDAERLLAGRDLYVDTSSAVSLMPKERAEELIRAFGTDHVLFGSDYPMWIPGQELKNVLALDLTQQQKQDILWNNAARLFGLGE